MKTTNPTSKCASSDPNWFGGGVFTQESRVCTHELYETSLIFFLQAKAKKYLADCEQRAPSSAKNKRRPFLSLPEKDEQRRRNRILSESLAIITTIIFSERVLEPE